MKNIFTILLCFIAYSYTFAQSPQSINYQAVIRNDAGIVVPNKAINLRFSIQEGLIVPPQYVEIHQVTTNSVGLVSLPIGKGIIQSGTFAGINWGLGIKYLKTEVDVTGGTNFSLIGTQQFLSVPYAMYAEKSGNGANNWSLSGNILTGNEFMGSLNNFPIIFKTNGVEKVRISEGGKLGLGVSNPTSWLSVQANGSGLSGTEDRIFLHLNNISTSSASSSNMQLTAGGSPNLTALTHHAPSYSVVSGYADFGQLTSTGSGLIMQARNGILRFETGANGNGVFERMRIANNGNIGVGTTNPLYKLHLEADATGFESGADPRSVIYIKNNSNSTASAAGITMSSGSNSGEGRLWHIAPTYSFRPQDQDFTTLYSSGRGISLWSSPKNNPNNGGYIKLQTGNKPDNTGGYDRLVINETGNIGIGTSNPSAQLHTTGSVLFSGILQNNSLNKVIVADANGSLAWRDATTLAGGSSGWGLSGNSLTGSEFIGSTNTQPIVFKTNGVEKTRISSDGMVGIATSNPLYKLHIEAEATGFESGADSRSFIFIKNTSNSTASAAGITMSSGSNSGEGRLWHIAPTYSFRPQDQDFTTLYSSGRGISLWTSPKNNPNNGGYIKLQTGNKPDNSGGYDRLVINELGNIGIGNSNPKAKVQVTDGDVYIDNAAKGVIMKSPNGSCFRVTVADNGTLVSTPIVCPN